MLSIVIPAAPDGFQPDFPPKPDRLSPLSLTPRAREQFNEWDVADREADTCDPEAQVFIAAYIARNEERNTWEDRREVQRLIQWPEYFLSHINPQLLRVAIAAPIYAQLLISHSDTKSAALALDKARTLILAAQGGK